MPLPAKPVPGVLPLAPIRLNLKCATTASSIQAKTRLRTEPSDDFSQKQNMEVSFFASGFYEGLALYWHHPDRDTQSTCRQ